MSLDVSLLASSVEPGASAGPLVQRSGLALRISAGAFRALVTAIALSAVALRAHLHLAMATGAVEETPRNGIEHLGAESDVGFWTRRSQVCDTPVWRIA